MGCSSSTTPVTFAPQRSRVIEMLERISDVADVSKHRSFLWNLRGHVAHSKQGQPAPKGTEHVEVEEEGSKADWWSDGSNPVLPQIVSGHNSGGCSKCPHSLRQSASPPPPAPRATLPPSSGGIGSLPDFTTEPAPLPCSANLNIGEASLSGASSEYGKTTADPWASEDDIDVGGIQRVETWEDVRRPNPGNELASSSNAVLNYYEPAGDQKVAMHSREHHPYPCRGSSVSWKSSLGAVHSGSEVRWGKGHRKVAVCVDDSDIPTTSACEDISACSSSTSTTVSKGPGRKSRKVKKSGRTQKRSEGLGTRSDKASQLETNIECFQEMHQSQMPTFLDVQKHSEVATVKRPVDELATRHRRTPKHMLVQHADSCKHNV